MKRSIHWFVVVAVLSLVACSSDSTPAKLDAAEARASVAVASAGDLTVELLTDSKLQTGMTPVYLKIAGATGELVRDAAVTLTPMMAMSTGMNHTCPVMGAPTLASDGVYVTNVVFLMPTSDAGSWSATVDIARPDGSAAQAVFPVLDIADSGQLQMFTYTDPVSAVVTKFITSLNFVTQPRIGLNPIVFTVHRRQDMMSFPSVDDAVIALDPQMPSMGHGSPGSVNPVLTSPGRYEGQLSFSMAGEWQTTATITEGAVAIGAPTFKTTF
jgi:hypothetical protein